MILRKRTIISSLNEPIMKNISKRVKPPSKKTFIDLPYHHGNWNVIKTTDQKKLLVELQLLLDNVMESKKVVVLSDDSKKDKKIMKTGRIKELNRHFVFGFRNVVKRLQKDPTQFSLILCDDVQLPILVDDLVQIGLRHGVVCVLIPGLSQTVWACTRVISSTICLAIKKNSERSNDFVGFCKSIFNTALKENNIILPTHQSYLPAVRRAIPKK